MVEVFKTNVKNQRHASVVIEHIHKVFPGYEVNFDLDDCDRILRVACREGLIHNSQLVTVLKEKGFHAEVLPDHIPLESAAGFGHRPSSWN